MTPAENFQGESIHRALETTHSILAGYRDLAYKITIANTTLLVALCYFAAPRPPDTSLKLCLPASSSLLLVLAPVLVAAPNLWWLWRLKCSVDDHLELARKLWADCGIKWPSTERDRPTMWWPLVVFVGVSTALAVAWVIAVRR